MGKRKAQDSPADSETKIKIRITGIKTKLAGHDPASQMGLEKVSHVDEDNVEVEEPLARDTQEEDAGDDEGTLRDFSSLSLKKDHPNRPLWVCTDGRIFLETFAPLYKQAYDFLIAIAEPVCRPETMHEYTLTPHSLYAAVSVGLETNTILTVLERLSKTNLSQDIRDFVCASTLNYGKVKLVLQKNKFMVESAYPEVLQELLKDEVFQRARVLPVSGAGAEGVPGRSAGVDGFDVSRAPQEEAAATLARTGQEESGEESALVAVRHTEGAEIEAERELHSFEIDASQVEHVKQRCLPGGLNYPMLEEYDFRNDTVNPDLKIELKPTANLRPYQEKGLSKMFGNGRARSGIIVLPCGAGKTLTAVAAASRVRKSALVLCTNSVSVDQWKHQFRLWTNLEDNDISKFTSQDKEGAKGLGGVTVSTYNMVAYTGSRSEASKKIIEMIQNREWGLLIMDEVHVVPATMFRKVIGIIKAHCKLGLTATLVREDDLISDLNFLIGPKLYEANWGDLSRDGHIAKVQCAEVWCPMTKEFFTEYLKKENASRKQLLYVMNPNKFQSTQLLMNFHEQQGDKILVFSDNIFALREYALRLKRPFIYGDISHLERTRILSAFKHSNQFNTVFISKVGDNSIDIPEANVIIQVSSHAGSRRQEAQRLGRILRAKPKKLGSSSSSEDEYNAYFYSLVSKDTVEMYYSTKRQQFLIDQGYSFKVVTNLLEQSTDAMQSGLGLGSKQEQIELLATVLQAGAQETGEEQLAEDPDEVDAKRDGAPSAVRRVADGLRGLSGAAGMKYMEYSSGAAPKKDPAKRHKLLRNR